MSADNQSERPGLQPRPGDKPFDPNWNNGSLQEAAQRIINTNARLGQPPVRPRSKILADDGSVITEDRAGNRTIYEPGKAPRPFGVNVPNGGERGKWRKNNI